ncbi:hypothetical protein RI367_004748 [Sorochytrium milnesiophthora]
MRNTLLLSLTVLAVALAASSSSSVLAQDASKNKVFSYYYPNPRAGIQPQDVPGNDITHLIWAFAYVQADGTVTLQGPDSTVDNVKNAVSAPIAGYTPTCKDNPLQGQLLQMYLLRQKYPHLNLIMSIGGWTWSTYFSKVISTPDLRAKVIQSSFDLMQTYGFNGLDIDWEFPATERTDDPNWTFSKDQDFTNLGQLFKEMRAYWVQQSPSTAGQGGAGDSKNWVMTMAANAYRNLGSADDWKVLADTLDYFLFMGYEYHHQGDTGGATRSGSPLYAAPDDSTSAQQNTVTAGANTYTGAAPTGMNIPPSKMVLGIPLYGVGWTGLDPNTPSRDNIPGFGIPIKSSNNQMMSPVPYFDLLGLKKNKVAGQKWTYTFDPTRVMGVLYNGTSVWFLDDVQTVAMKAQWAAKQGFGGVMFWNSNQDVNDAGDSLMASVASVYPVSNATTLTKKDICFQKSKYCNLLCSDPSVSSSKPLIDNTGTPSGNGNGNGNGGSNAPVFVNSAPVAQGSLLLAAAAIAAAAAAL